MKYYHILLCMLFVVSCEEPEKGTCSINGIVDVNGISEAFIVKLVPGEINDLSQIDDNPDASIFITEGDGVFQFDGLDAGYYTLQVAKTGYYWLYMTIEGRDGWLDMTNSHYVGLKNGETKDIKVVMRNDSYVTENVLILDDEGREISKITFPRNTETVSFHLFNRNGFTVPWGTYCNCIVISSDQLNYSRWVKTISPASGILEPGRSALVIVTLDPAIYSLAEHSSCEISIVGSKVTLSY